MPQNPPRTKNFKQDFRRRPQGGATGPRAVHEPRLLEADEAGPAAIVSRRASDKLRAGHLWVYRTDVEDLIPALGATTMAAGALVTLMDSRRIPLGTAIYSDASLLALRKVSSEAEDPPWRVPGRCRNTCSSGVEAA
jgi:23S rRNA (cytosine1962-C5)-methyltransferase